MIDDDSPEYWIEQDTLILDGEHPTIKYQDVIERCGLDD
jgi:hypothetical protein